MSLSIRYRLTTSLSASADVRRLVETMRQLALDLPFEEVSEPKEWTAHEATDQEDAEAPERWLKAQADAFVVEGHDVHWVPPRHAIVFSAWPGEGCGLACFGFALYPSCIDVESSDGNRRRLATNLTGWQWSADCTTQYASNPKYGGLGYFLHCHLCVIQMLDRINENKLAKVEVWDEGRYWEGRDRRALGNEVVHRNEDLAGFVSILRMALGKKIEGPITEFPNFEHLEAKGLEKLADLRRVLVPPEGEE